MSDLENGTVSEEIVPGSELVDMTRRFWIGTALTVPTAVLEMTALSGFEPSPLPLAQGSVFLQFVFATPVVLWNVIAN